MTTDKKDNRNGKGARNRRRSNRYTKTNKAQGRGVRGGMLGLPPLVALEWVTLDASNYEDRKAFIPSLWG